MRGDIAESRAAGERVAGPPEARTTAGGWPGTDGAVSGHIVPVLPLAFVVRGGKEGGGKGYLGSEDQALTLSTVQEQYLAEPVAFIGGFDGSIGNLTPVAPTLVGTGEDERGIRNALVMQPTDEPIAVALAFALRGREGGAAPEVSGDRTNALRGAGGGSSRDYVAFAENSRAELRLEGGDGQVTGALSTGGGKPGQGTPAIATPYAVRRLTPVECERLQGFPDDHTRYDADGSEIADTHRYRMCGNAVTVNVIEWIGRRILAVSA